MEKLVTEYDIQLAIVQYVQYQYPGVMWYSDLNGVKLTQGQAVKVKRLQMPHDKWLDLFFPEPRGVYSGLFIELKTSKDKYLTKSGDLRQSEHIKAQWSTIVKLNERGYYAAFADYDEALRLVNWYFGEPG